MKDTSYFENWLTDVLASAKKLPRESEGHYNVAQVAAWRSGAEYLLVEIVGKKNPYYERFVEASRKDRNAYAPLVESCIAIMEAVLTDFLSGRLRSFRNVVEAEIFSDFIDMAEHILDNDYFVAAASLMGGVLERGLRSIADSNDVALGASGDLVALNNRLAQKGIYNALRQKEVHYYIGIRNYAAHGNFDKFSADDARRMITGVRALLAEKGS